MQVQLFLTQIVECRDDHVAVEPRGQNRSYEISFEDTAVLALARTEAVQHDRRGSPGADCELGECWAVRDESAIDQHGPRTAAVMSLDSTAV